MTPAEMERDDKAQKKWIIKKLYQKEGREQIQDYTLPVGTLVRFMIPKTMMKKRRFKVSQEVVEVVKVSGASYTCQAADGSKKTFSRWRLFPEKSGKLARLPSFIGLEREKRLGR
jgi:hypothetical protein